MFGYPFRETGSAIAHGQQRQFRVGASEPYATGNSGGGGLRRQRLFERSGRDQDPHGEWTTPQMGLTKSAKSYCLNEQAGQRLSVSIGHDKNLTSPRSRRVDHLPYRLRELAMLDLPQTADMALDRHVERGIPAC